MVFSDLGYYVLICLIWVMIFVVFWSIAGFLIYRFVDRKLRACPNCRKRAAGMIQETEIEPLTTKIEHTGKESVQIKSEKVTDHYQCKHCEHTWLRTYERKERIPIEKQP
jgi:hypothetical protein